MLSMSKSSLIRLAQTVSTSTNNIKKSVLISQSKDIFTNLALEDWLYKNFDFSNHQILLLWQNEPCVVIGRHQNPWLEANISGLGNITSEGVKFARRNSGGGTVFHDLGNLNMTFFTAKNHYNRRRNLEIITRALLKKYGVKIEISSRDDLILKNCKVSGTAAKLGRPNAYHHCTLLVDTNKTHLSQALKTTDWDIETNATKSTKAPIMNLQEENPEIEVSSLFEVIGGEYLRTNRDIDITDVDPSEKLYPGLEETKNNLKSWEWRFGKTPKFTITHLFEREIKIRVVVENGKISNVSLLEPNKLLDSNSLIDNVIGHRFSEEAFYNIEWSLKAAILNKEKFSV